MRKRPFNNWWLLVALLALPIFALSQVAQQSLTLIVNGRPGDATVVQMNGRSYVEIEALARVANGSLSFKGNQIILTLAASTATPVAASCAPALPVARAARRRSACCGSDNSIPRSASARKSAAGSPGTATPASALLPAASRAPAVF